MQKVNPIPVFQRDEIESFQNLIEEGEFDSRDDERGVIAACIAKMEILEQSGNALPEGAFLYSLDELREMLTETEGEAAEEEATSRE